MTADDEGKKRMETFLAQKSLKIKERHFVGKHLVTLKGHGTLSERSNVIGCVVPGNTEAGSISVPMRSCLTS